MCLFDVCVQDYIIRRLQMEQDQMSEDVRLIRQYQEDTAKKRSQIQELRTSWVWLSGSCCFWLAGRLASWLVDLPVDCVFEITLSFLSVSLSLFNSSGYPGIWESHFSLTLCHLCLGLPSTFQCCILSSECCYLLYVGLDVHFWVQFRILYANYKECIPAVLLELLSTYKQ